MFDQQILTWQKQLRKHYPKLPVYLVVGPEKSGKSILLENHVGLNLWEQSITGQPCWIGEGAVYLEHTLPLDNLSNNEAFDQLASIIRCLKKQCAGILLACPITTFYAQSNEQDNLTQWQALGRQLARTLLALQPHHHVPVDVIITQSDRVVGFAEFFDNLTGKERQQAWGTSCSNPKEAATLHQQLTALVDALDRRIILRAHQEHQTKRRIRIKDFPGHLRALVEPLAAWAGTLNSGNQHFLRNIYFTSSKQPAQTNTTKYLTVDRSFFTEELFNKQLAQLARTKPASNKQRDPRLQWGALAASAAALSLMGIISHSHYNQSMLALNNLQKQIAENTIQVFAADNQDGATNTQTTVDGVFKNELLAKLNTRYKAAYLIDDNHQHRTTGFAHLQHTANTNYQTALSQQLLPYLKSSLESQLKQADTQDPSDVFYALQAYLMLNDPAHFNTTTLSNWFATHFNLSVTDNAATTQNLTRGTDPRPITHIHQLFSLGSPSLALDKDLIDKARHRLSERPLPNLVLHMVLKQMARNDDDAVPHISLSLDQGVFLQKELKIPVMYTADNLHRIYRHAIPMCSHMLTNSQWVFNDDADGLSADKITAQAQSRYLFYYKRHWTQALNSINLQPVNNIRQANALLTALLTPTSPLRENLTTIVANTGPQKNLPAFTQKVSSGFESLMLFLEHMDVGSLHNAMEALNHEVDLIAQDKAPGQAAFNLALKRFNMKNLQQDSIEALRREIRQFPLSAPLYSWLETIPDSTWGAILDETHTYIDHQWNQKVWAKYDKLLNHRYPLFKETPHDASVKAFATFFNPKGDILSFFQQYVEPFVDTKHLYWTWKSLDGKHVDISQANLEMFMRAALVKKMFFPGQHKNPQFKFSMIPVALMPSVRKLHLQIGLESLNYTHNDSQIHHLSWPMRDANHVTLQFIDNTGAVATHHETGPWALFRLLDKAHLQTTHDVKRYELTLDLNGNAAKYELLADTQANPFIQGILENFRCPKHL